MCLTQKKNLNHLSADPIAIHGPRRLCAVSQKADRPFYDEIEIEDLLDLIPGVYTYSTQQLLQNLSKSRQTRKWNVSRSLA